MTTTMPATLQLEKAERDAWEDLYRACPADVAARLGLAAARLGGALYLRLQAIDHGQFNRLCALGLEDDAVAAESAAKDATARFQAAGIRNAWYQVSPSPQQAEIDTRLGVLGHARHQRRWVKFHRAPSPVGAPKTDLTIIPAAGSEANAFAETALAGFGLPPILAPWLAALVERPGWQCFLAMADDRPAGAAALFVKDGWAWCGIDGMRPEFRGRGGQSALLAARIAAGLAAGVQGFATETGLPLPGEPSPSYHNIQRAGFAIAYERANWVLPPA